MVTFLCQKNCIKPHIGRLVTKREVFEDIFGIKKDGQNARLFIFYGLFVA